MSLTTKQSAGDRRTMLWNELGGDPAALERIEAHGPPTVLPSVFDVTGFAADTVAIASLSIAELWAARTGREVPAVRIDRRAAAASFRFEALLRSLGWELPPVWDPVAGDYRTADGWVRLHTNYESHRRAAMSVLGTPPERDVVATAVRSWMGEDLEAAIVDAGGCAAVLRTEAEWRLHPAGIATAGEAPVRLGGPVPVHGGAVPDLAQAPEGRPLAGIRVLDLTRVIAGPVATRILAGYGALVLRVDPPGFQEVPALLPETTAGKRCAALDLKDPTDRRRFDALVANAHVVVGGLRPGALAGLGCDPASLRAINPSIITVTHDAYGWDGPWAQRRGFDSLVQMSTGIAAAGRAATGAGHPVPLPAQALDHGVGHLLAAAACRALVRLITTGATADARGSLAGAANAVLAAPTPGALSTAPPHWDDADTVAATTAFGSIRRVPLAGQIDDHEPTWTVEAGPLGRHDPIWS
ncbi:MAG: CoA transferase [Acidimicrobiales bacterium]